MLNGINRVKGFALHGVKYGIDLILSHLVKNKHTMMRLSYGILSR